MFFSFNNIFKIMLFLIFLCIVNSYGITLLNSSYDVSRELFSEINSSFILYWNKIHPTDHLIIRQSHAGSTRQAMAVLQGLPADVVTYNQVVDVQILCDLGKLIPKNWQDRFPNHSSPFYSTMAFLVRKDNPKKIYGWNDLIKKDLKIVFPHPKISGNGRYAYLAAWCFFLQKNNGNVEQTRDLMLRFINNVIVFDTGGRSATSTFVDRKQGDILINFESEARFVQNKYGCENYELIVPKLNILVEFPVTWIDKNVKKHGTENVSKSYLQYLYTLEAQKIISKFWYRTNYQDFVKKNCTTEFLEVHFFKVENLIGNWSKIMQIHFRKGGELDQLLRKGH